MGPKDLYYSWSRLTNPLIEKIHGYKGQPVIVAIEIMPKIHMSTKILRYLRVATIGDSIVSVNATFVKLDVLSNKIAATLRL